MYKPKPEYQIKEVIEKERDWHDDNKQKMIIVEKYVAPCGRRLNKIETRYGKLQNGHWLKYERPLTIIRSKEDIIAEHCENCKVCKIVVGRSQQKTLSQQQVADLFGLGIDGKTSSTGNFYSVAESDKTGGRGILFHYNTIQAVRLEDGTVITNTQCWSGGFAQCSTPDNAKFRMPLTTISRAIGAPTLIQIINTRKNGYDYDILFTHVDNALKHYLLGHDNRRMFLIELPKQCKTVKQAYDILIPESVKNLYESERKTVERQGELFFIPTQRDLVAKKFHGAMYTKESRRTSTEVKRGVWKCKKCGIKTAQFITQTPNVRYTEDIKSERIHPHVAWYNIHATEKQKHCVGTAADLELIERDGYKYSSYPRIRIYRELPNMFIETNHTATVTLEIGNETYVKGVVRNSPDHKPLKLYPNVWYKVDINTAKRSFPLAIDGGGD